MTGGLLKDRVALITGTAGGQGRDAAMAFARAGAIVIGCDISEEGHDELLWQIEQVGGHAKFFDGVDLGDAVQAGQWIEQAAGLHDRIDILYNNASAARFAPFASMSIDDWRFTLRNELDILFHVTRPAWKWLARRGGVIINTASVIAHAAGSEGCAAHAAAKGGVLALGRQLALEGAADNIRVVTISPGFIATPGTAAVVADPPSREALLRDNLIKRPGFAREIADLAVFLASDQAAYITGSDIVIDGGRLAC